MEKKEITKLINSYRESSAFIAAYSIGVFRNLYSKAMTIKCLSKQIGVNESKLSLLMIYLKSFGVVEEVKDIWKLTESMFQNYSSLEKISDVINHEKNIFQKWMYPAQLEQALYAPEGKRNFDIVGFSQEEQILYDKTMYGMNLKILGLLLIRQIRNIKHPIIIEYGRSRDNILNALSQAGYQFEGYCMPEESVLQNENQRWNGNYKILSQSEKDIRVDIVFLYNTIHYYDEKTLEYKLTNLKKILNKDALVIIIDLFINSQDDFSVNYLVDWITHGGVNFITLESTEDMFRKNGFDICRSIKSQEINSNILIMRM